MLSVRIPPGRPEAQYRRAGLMIVMTCLPFTTVVTLLSLMVVKNAAFITWHARRGPASVPGTGWAAGAARSS
ncbi:hypothetical protein [Deinococcus daejeonensis]|uniref:hypothetical protein n=1 Tax=Deinococcus daejeonensis TaxID=1007098 RepID=UPI00166DF65F|nr:hypothetical protein [Deinococcus daejeonensis]